MNICLIIWIILFCYYLLASGNEYNKKAINRYIAFGCTLFALASGLRHIDVGPDTIGYYSTFYHIMKMSWNEVFSYLFVDATEFRDPGYKIFNKLFSTIIPSWQIYCLSIASLFYYAIYRLLSRFVFSLSGVLLSFSLILALFLVITMSGMRQLITMSISLLIMPYLEDRKWMKAIPIILMGSLIHISFLFCLFYIPLCYLSHSWLHRLQIIAICLVPVIAISASPIVAFLAGFSANDYYMQYSEAEGGVQAITFIAVSLLMCIFLMINNRLIQSNFLMSAIILMILSTPLLFLEGTMIRITQYYTIYLIILVPMVLDTFQKRNILYFVMIIFLLYAIANTWLQYSFFWQETNGHSYSHPFWGL